MTMRNEHTDNDFKEIVDCFFEMRELVGDAFDGLLYSDKKDDLTERVAAVLRQKPSYASFYLTAEERGE